MSKVFTWPMLVLVICCILLETAREICFKKAADNESFRLAVAKPITWLGMAFWVGEVIACTVVLQRVPLSVAFPLMALSYAALVVAGAWFLKEPITPRHALGALLITLGAACVGATGL